MASPPDDWRLPDVIDYELFLDADEREPVGALRQRDRGFVGLDDDVAESPAAARRGLLRRWLEARRDWERRRRAHSREDVILPGEAFGQVVGAARVLLGVAGLTLGWTAARAALAYAAGAEPINAFTFFVEFAVVQLALVSVALLAASARHLAPGGWQMPSLMRAVLRVVGAAAGAVWRRGRARLAGPGGWAEVQAGFGVLRRRGRLYGRAYAWSLVRMAQVFAVMFNLGVLGAMTTRHLFHDLDFGWESTWLDAGSVHRVTEVFARPWAALTEPAGPDLAQVIGSQIRKRDPARLDPASLKSWSHFLFAAVLCYGLLPRLALLGWAGHAERGALRRLRFNDGRSEALLDRLRTPTVETTGRPTNAAVLPPPPAVALKPVNPAPPEPARSPARPRAASHLGTREIFLNLTGLPLAPAQAVRAVRGAADSSRAEVLEAGTLDPSRDEETFAHLARGFASVSAEDATPELTVVFAGWTAPALAAARLLDRARAAAGPEGLIKVALLGKPARNEEGGGFRPVREADRAIWARVLDARGDPFLLLLPATADAPAPVAAGVS